MKNLPYKVEIKIADNGFLVYVSYKLNDNEYTPDLLNTFVFTEKKDMLTFLDGVYSNE